MGRSKAASEKKWRAIRFVTVCVAWALYLFVTLSCLTYNSHDWRWGGSPSVYNPHAPSSMLRCGSVGATTGGFLYDHFGGGILVVLALIGGFLVQWTRARDLKDWPLRLIGGSLVMIMVSASLFLWYGSLGRPDGPGGMLGMATGDFLLLHFGHPGTALILALTLVVGLLLIADEFMLALPGRMVAAWNSVPRRKLAGAAVGAAGGIWSNFREFMDHLHMPRRPRRAASTATVETRPDDTPAFRNPPEQAPAPATETPAPTAPEIGEPVTATAVAEAPNEDLSPPAPREPVIRKAVPPKQAPLPFKPPAPPPAHKAQDFGNYRLPGLELLDEPEPLNPQGQEARIREKSKALEAALVSFGIEGHVEAIDTGPVVTLFELGLAPGVKSSQVAALSKDIARALKSPPVRIIDNIPGKSTMGIEVPNLDRERVRLKELMLAAHDNIERMQLPMCLGKDASGNPLIEDLAKMPHMLIAGTTGSGKSVCINSIIMTLLLTQRPDHVKMIMVDPKMVEMQDYKSIPHLMAPIIDDMSKAESILEWATHKMDERYEVLSEARVRHIREFNKLTRDQIVERFNAITEDDRAKLVYHMPYIVIVIDELADLMMTSKDVEGHIVRIAQKARAVGIHLILSTQRPEAQVVTGLIKSNMPGRICFQVRSRLDSRIMLDQAGGELLLGQGDLLMLKPTGGAMLRGQGAFVDDNEMKRVTKFLEDIAVPEFHPELMQIGQPQGLGDEERDPLYNDAVDIMIESGRGSVSLVQRRLNIGYSRASRLIDQMRRTGIVGAYKGSMASEVVITKEEWEVRKAEEASATGSTGMAAGEDEGETGSCTGGGASVGYAQQVNSTFDEDDEGGVPDEMPGEHRQ